MSVQSPLVYVEYYKTREETFFMAKQQVMRITLKAYDHQLIDASANKIVETVKKTGSKVSGPVPLPTKKLRVPCRKSPDGEGSETWDRWEMRIHKRLIDLDADERALRQLMRIQVPDGVNIEIVLRSA